MLITVFYKQERVHKDFVLEGKTVSSELIIRTATGKGLMERILREKAVGPF